MPGQRSENFFQSGGWRKETSQALILLGRANRLKGDYETALNAFRQQLKLSEEVGDQAQSASAHSSIATTLAYRERYSRNHSTIHEESYRINLSLNAKFNIEYDLVNRASVLWQLGDYQAARASLEQALAVPCALKAAFKVSCLSSI